MSMKITQKFRRVVFQGTRIFLIFGILVGTLPVLVAQSTYAEACIYTVDPSANDILFSDMCEQPTCSAGTGGLTTITSLRGDNNGDKIYNYWLDAGFASVQSAGITGSMKHEGGFSPFRQEGGKTWPDGGWGIAQFTHDPGQRGNATAYVRAAVGDSLFNAYYSSAYGGAVLESNGFIPTGVPTDVNDKFLLAELNYLQETIKGLVPNNTRWDWYKRDWNVDKADGVFLYDYLKTVNSAGDAAKAWTYLYEAPADIKATSTVRATSAEQILQLQSTGSGISTSCGGNLTAGGMNLEQAKAFMDSYKNNPSNADFIGTAARTCNGGPLSNCVSFSMYFVNKFTSIDGTKRAGNGSIVVSNLVANNPSLGLETGHSPRPYAIFSTPSGSQMCGNVKCGHTGVVLGVDTVNQKIIIGEAGCSDPASWDGAHEYPLANFDNENYTYLYTENFLTGSVQ